MRFCKLGLFLALLAAISIPAVAQTELHFDVPFSFIAAGKVMPAGHYTVIQALNNNNAAWSFLGDHGSFGVLTNSVESHATAHQPSLIFLQQGGQLSLVQIWSSQHFGRQVMQQNVKSTTVAQGGKYVEVGAE